MNQNITVTSNYTIHCARCGNAHTWTPPYANSADEAIRRTLAVGWAERGDGMICFECVMREGEAAR